MRTSRYLILLALCALAFVGCGSGEERVNPGAQPSGASDDVRYTCGGPSFDPAKLEGPGDLEKADSPLGQALRALLATPDGSMGGAKGWRILSERDEEVLVAAPSPGGGHPYVSATFRRAGSGWGPAGWGDCLPTADIGGRGIALWELDGPVDEETTEVQISVNERGCSSGRKLEEDQIHVEVGYLEDHISILTTVDPPPGGAHTCPSNPSTSITVKLDQPVGDRRLVDAGSYPPS